MRTRIKRRLCHEARRAFTEFYAQVIRSSLPDEERTIVLELAAKAGAAVHKATMNAVEVIR